MVNLNVNVNVNLKVDENVLLACTLLAVGLLGMIKDVRGIFTGQFIVYGFFIIHYSLFTFLYKV